MIVQKQLKIVKNCDMISRNGPFQDYILFLKVLTNLLVLKPNNSYDIIHVPLLATKILSHQGLQSTLSLVLWHPQLKQTNKITYNKTLQPI